MKNEVCAAPIKWIIMNLTWYFLAFIIGMLPRVQMSIYEKLNKSRARLAHASLFRFLIAVAAMVLYLPFSMESIECAESKWALLLYRAGSVLCASGFIFVPMLVLPHLGLPVTFSLVVAGQLAISVLTDHFSQLFRK
jgi:uncharacterized membrane protein YdcZ (DUF606 family)